MNNHMFSLLVVAFFTVMLILLCLIIWLLCRTAKPKYKKPIIHTLPKKDPYRAVLTCVACGEKGDGDFVILDNGKGPYCSECYRKIVEVFYD